MKSLESIYTWAKRNNLDCEKLRESNGSSIERAPRCVRVYSADKKRSIVFFEKHEPEQDHYFDRTSTKTTSLRARYYEENEQLNLFPHYHYGLIKMHVLQAFDWLKTGEWPALPMEDILTWQVKVTKTL